MNVRGNEGEVNSVFLVQVRKMGEGILRNRNRQKYFGIELETACGIGDSMILIFSWTRERSGAVSSAQTMHRKCRKAGARG